VPALALLPILGSSIGRQFLLARRNITDGDPRAYINLIPGHPQLTYHWRKNDGVVHASLRDLAEGKANFELRSTPELLIGTRIYDAMGLGLIDVLTDPGIIVDAEAHSVTLIDFVPHRSGGALTVEVYFDPDHGFLPKIIQTTLTSSKQKYMQRWEVLEYFEIEDGATGESRWFPRKAVLKQDIPNSVTMEVVDAAVNIEIPAETFTPDLPEGSQIYDARKKVPDEPKRSNRISILLITGGILLILIAVSRIAYRQLRSS
jgi:hypothetical protein